MSEPIIKVNNVSKRYKIGEAQPYITLRDTLVSFWKKTPSKGRDEFWSLQDVSFTVNPGEIVGIIGKNGAGKSTLLKILSKITPPTKGEIELRGKVASLLEVGTGFSPELTGRENIYLNAAILGMTKKEIDDLFDEIVSFAEVEKFIDTPVKHYSSGMYMRLAFAVAAHLKSDILFVDEVLAVGDAAFQVKCLEKMGEISKQGRTILFVSHSMQAVARLCTRAIWIDQGSIKLEGNTQEVIRKYLDSGQKRSRGKAEPLVFPKNKDKVMQIRKISLKTTSGKLVNILNVGEPFVIEVEFDVTKPVLEVYFSAVFSTPEHSRFLDALEADHNIEALHRKRPGRYLTKIEVPGWLNADDYNVLLTFESGQQTFDKVEALNFKITDAKVRTYNFEGRAPLLAPFVWTTEKLK